MTKNKQKVAKECEKLFKQIIIEKVGGKCEVCNSNFEITVHHYIPRSLAGHMIYWIENGVCLCRGCHFQHHTRSDPRIHDMIKRRRGEKWLKEIEKKRLEPKKPSFKTLQWLENQLKELKKNG